MRPITWPQRVPEEGQLGRISTTRENPTVGPALPPGRSQPIRISDETDDNDEIGEEDDQSDKDDHNFGSPLAGQEEGVLAGLLMDLVRHKDKSKAYLIIDEFMTRMKKMEKKIRELSEGRGSRKKEENFREAVREAVAKEVEQAVGGLREEIREIRRALKKGGS